MINCIFGIFTLTVMAFFTYMGLHIAEEKRQGKSLPLIWERKDDD